VFWLKLSLIDQSNLISWLDFHLAAAENYPKSYEFANLKALKLSATCAVSMVSDTELHYLFIEADTNILQFSQSSSLLPQ
jgi:hypothetical protein